MHLCVLHAFLVPAEARKGCQILKLDLRMVVNHSPGYWELKKHQEILTSEPSLQSLMYGNLKGISKN